MNKCGHCGRVWGDGAPIIGCTCRSCSIRVVEGLLSSSGWLAVRGVAKGDLEGETLKDTMERELAELRGQLEVLGDGPA